MSTGGVPTGGSGGAAVGASAAAALEGARRVPLWLDDPSRPAPRQELDADLVVDLVVVGGGFTGLWAALLAVQEQPGRSVALLEAGTLGWAASGRNGGFCSASLTHGLANGLKRWPNEMPVLQRLGSENLHGILDTIAEAGIACDLERTGDLTVAVAPWQREELRSAYDVCVDLGVPAQWLETGEVRALVNSPTYLAGLRIPEETVIVNPARLVWGLAGQVERLGVTIHERTRVTALADEGGRVRVETTGGVVRARQVVLATNAFRSRLPRVRPYLVPVWDHVLATQPLRAEQKAAIGWAGREGLSDAGNQFHYYRLTADDRIVWGGYDAVYYFGSDLSSRRQRRPATEGMLAANFLRTFPQLEGIAFSHAWAGAVDTCTRFTAFWVTSLGGKAAAVQGYTGLGVGASRFGAQVALDLLDGRENERTRLDMVRRKPVPFPPEPVRWAGITMTRWSIARADAAAGRRNLWLRTLDRMGLGFDS